MSGIQYLENGAELRGGVGGAARGVAGAAWRCVLLAVILVAIRLPFVGHPRPVHPDELSFVAAIGFPAEYPVQHPGYPGWVALGTALAWLGLPGYVSYQVWSIVASAVGPVVAYWVFRRFLAEGTAWWLGLALGVNPLMWFMSVTALAYPMGTAIGLGTILLIVMSVRQQEIHYLLYALLIMVLGWFVRGDLIVYLMCLFLIANSKVANRQNSWIAPVFLLVSLFVFLRFSNLLYSGVGGFEATLRFEHTRDVMLNTSVFRAGLMDGLARNVIKVGVNLGWDLGLAFPVFVISVVYLTRRWRTLQSGAWVVAAWLLPGLLFLACFHVVQGYFLILLPAALLCIGLAMERWRGVAVARRVAIGIVVASTVQFLAYPWSAESTGWKRTVDGKIGFLSRAGLMGIDQRERIHEDGDFWRTGAHESPH